MHLVPYYYAPGGKYVLFLDLLGFTQFVRASFQKAADVEGEKAYEAALKGFEVAQMRVAEEYRRFHQHLGRLLRRPVRRGKPPVLSLVFSDCAYVVFDKGADAERFAVAAMRSFVRNDMPVRMGLAHGSFTSHEFTSETLSSGHRMFGAPFMGTAVIDSYCAESSGIKGMRILVHPSFYCTASDGGSIVPLPKSEQRPEAVGELNWYDLPLHLRLRRHIRKMKRLAPVEAHVHYDKTLCFIRRMEEFRSWYCHCCRTNRVANVLYPERKKNLESYRRWRRTKAYQRQLAEAKLRAGIVQEQATMSA